MQEVLSYDDILLVPQYSDIRTRNEVDILSNLGKGVSLKLPIVSAPMDTISENNMAVAMTSYGGTSIIHRYNAIEEQTSLVKDVCNFINLKFIPRIENNVGAAIGITGDYLERATELLDAGVDFLCIDVAHGHHIVMKEALRELRKMCSDNFHIMAGNVATLQGINDLSDWGADSVRCNIGGGSICSTRIQTGHGMPGLQTIMECAQTDRDVAIIADGGIRNSGDIVKALAAGAHAVMCGSLLAGTDETPGKVLEDSDGLHWKSYRGMASKEAQVSWRGRYSSFEGVSARVPYRGSVRSILEDLERGIRSGLSYSGCRSIDELHARAQFVRQTHSGLSESHTHIKTREW
jgi:IMP dehydrogenase